MIEIDLAVDVTDTYSRVKLRKAGDGYEGTFKAYSAFDLDKIYTGAAKLAHVQTATRAILTTSPNADAR
jgi:hypothetical protein